MIEQRHVRADLRLYAIHWRAVAVALVVGPIALPGWPSAAAHEVASSKVAGPESVPNYGVIWEGKLTRSAQPSDGGGWRWLRDQGVRSVVNFRSEEDDTRVGFEHVLWLPFTKAKPPTDRDAEKFLRFVRDPLNWRVHIHCKEGRDRTSLMTALVRYAIDGWPLERALAEARTYREGEDLAPNYVAWLQGWAAGHPPASHRLEPPANSID